MHGGSVSTVTTGACDEALAGGHGHRMLDARYSALPIIEISDKDYRSFCWPCHALEETGDGQSAGT